MPYSVVGSSAYSSAYTRVVLYTLVVWLLQHCAIEICFVYLDAQASLAPTYVNPSVGNTFVFPLPLNISVQQWSLMSISYFIKIVCVCVCVFRKFVFSLYSVSSEQ